MLRSHFYVQISESTQISLMRDHLRATADHDAAHAVGKAEGVHTGNIVIDDLHLTALEFTNFKQTDLMLLWVL